jgi:uncharacterized protein YqjF (DUF2071 family)
MAGPFLTARWSNLCLISYLVPRALLEPRLAPGLELDITPGTPDDMGAVSLVAFDFLDTRVRSVRWPRHVNFPEINLRFYVRLKGAGDDPSRRGVMFIREFVPRRLISIVARAIYNEPYAPARMTSVTTRTPDTISVEHRMILPGAGTCRIQITAANPPTIPPKDSLEHWFKEHEWGFGRSRAGRLLTYQVHHPVWAIFGSPCLDLDFDWAGAYGNPWKFLAQARPFSVVLAEGSPVEVHPKRILKGA